jgi:hypothetical protein
MRVARLFSTCAILAALGCSGEAVPAPANLAGTWDFSYVTTSDAGVSCHGSMTFTITQTDQTFSGVQQNAGILLCDGARLALPNFTDPTQFVGEMITAGVVSPNEVAFQLNTLESHDAGTVVQAGLMTGTSVWQLRVAPKGTITVSGTWTAIERSPAM